ncbi:hypothetical protein OG777_07865 [Micromonospora peucetia]|uniref:hypothetical protein n=1 Tax=Micromonospora peucetia TaxID=47871 RepID=UPI00225AFAB8|nr:hypothetical protein [Micromonospora peucetia]MCX4386842.1 hypothetical protein [Micromonospora peucetia]
MTTPTSGNSPDEYWRRPDTSPEWPAVVPAASPPARGSGYPGPPPTTPPPAGWRPPVHLRPPPPRRLPPQDMAELDAAEQRAQRLTYGVGTVAGVLLVVLVCVLCSRLLF